MQSAIHSTFCSMDWTMLLSTDGLPGPAMMWRLGKPAVATPSSDRGPSFHFSASERPPMPRMSMRVSGPVMASNPVAKISASNSYSRSPTLRPARVISPIGVSLTSTRVTLSRL